VTGGARCSLPPVNSVVADAHEHRRTHADRSSWRKGLQWHEPGQSFFVNDSGKYLAPAFDLCAVYKTRADASLRSG